MNQDQAHPHLDFKGLEVAIVENDFHNLRGLQHSLERLGCRVVWTARDEEEARAAAARHLPAVAFVDLRLERGSDDYRPGWHLVQHLHHLGVDKPLKTIIYSGTPMTDEIVLEAVRLGCSYVVKEDLWEHELELIASALLAAQAGSVLLSNEVAGGIETIVNQLETGALLTDKEWEVLKLLATGLTNKQIGRRLFIAVTTVKSHVSSILDKLGVDNRVQAAEWYRRQNS